MLDPDKPSRVTIVGSNDSGKSVLARYYWHSWPYDRGVLDVTGDADPGEDVRPIEPPFPQRFPAALDDDDKRVSVRYKPDPGSPTYLDDMDRFVGMCFRHPRERCLLWDDDITEVWSVNQTQPNARRVLRQSRHHGLSWLLCGPRPIGVDRLALAQASFVYVFDLPDEDDRRRVAKTIGYDVKDFDAAVQHLDRYEYLRWDKTAKELTHFPPLPLHRLRDGRLDIAG